MASVSLTQMPYVTQKIGVPRAVAVEFPFGMIWGLPNDRIMHRTILMHLLDAAENIKRPGTIVELPYTWPEDLTEKRDWFPKEPPPWLTSKEKIQQMLDFIQSGNPLE
jgi:D-proline reductase (dithiol) PrdB